MDLPDHFGCCTIASLINDQMNRTRVDCNSQLKEGHYRECVTTGGLYRPARLCVAHFQLHKNVSDSFFCDVIRLGVFGGVVHVSGGMGFQRGAV